MNTATTLTLAAALPIAAIATAGAAAAAALAPPSGEVPDDWTTLVDDTGTIAISVPSAWTATDGSPVADDKGTLRPMISATTDEALFAPPDGVEDTYGVPGVIFYAIPMVALAPARLEAVEFDGDCTAGPIETYDDGAYVGYIRSLEGCGGTASRIVELVANPRLGSVTLVLVVQLTGRPDDAAIVDGLLSSFVDFSSLDDGPLAVVQQLLDIRSG